MQEATVARRRRTGQAGRVPIARNIVERNDAGVPGLDRAAGAVRGVGGERRVSDERVAQREDCSAGAHRVRRPVRGEAAVLNVERSGRGDRPATPSAIQFDSAECPVAGERHVVDRHVAADVQDRAADLGDAAGQVDVAEFDIGPSHAEVAVHAAGINRQAAIRPVDSQIVGNRKLALFERDRLGQIVAEDPGAEEDAVDSVA